MQMSALVLELVDHKMEIFTQCYHPHKDASFVMIVINSMSLTALWLHLTANHTHICTHTHISSHTECINILDVLYFKLVRMFLSVLISVTQLLPASSFLLPAKSLFVFLSLYLCLSVFLYMLSEDQSIFN